MPLSRRAGGGEAGGRRRRPAPSPDPADTRGGSAAGVPGDAPGDSQGDSRGDALGGNFGDTFGDTLGDTLGDLVARAADHGVGGGERRRRFAVLVRALPASGRAAGARALLAGRWLADVVTEAAPRLPVRDAATLRAHHPGRSVDETAEALVRAASLATAAVGGAAGALAAVEFAAPPTLLAVPAQLAAETLAVAAIEIKLVAELHELYGQGARGSPVQRGAAYLSGWVGQRALDPVAGAGLAGMLGEAAKRELRSRLVRRLGRSATSLAPFLAGAVAGSEVNRRATRALGQKVGAQLRQRRADRRELDS